MDGHDLVEFREQPPHVLGSHDDVEFSGPRGLVARSFKRLELHVRTSVSAFASTATSRALPRTLRRAAALPAGKGPSHLR